MPKNTTPIIQPMIEGIILATKRLYRKQLLHNVNQKVVYFAKPQKLQVSNFDISWQAVKIYNIDYSFKVLILVIFLGKEKITEEKIE